MIHMYYGKFGSDSELNFNQEFHYSNFSRLQKQRVAKNTKFFVNLYRAFVLRLPDM